MRSYADTRRERITFTLCIVQLHYVNTPLLSWVRACAPVRVHTLTFRPVVAGLS